MKHLAAPPPPDSLPHAPLLNSPPPSCRPASSGSARAWPGCSSPTPTSTSPWPPMGFGSSWASHRPIEAEVAIGGAGGI
eukprot:scaffold18289_cov126-Isochrysis_galbana.AAC.1